MKKNSYERPTITLIAIGGKDDLLEKGNIPISGSIDHGGGRADDVREQSGDLWEDDEFDPQNPYDEE